MTVYHCRHERLSMDNQSAVETGLITEAGDSEVHVEFSKGVVGAVGMGVPESVIVEPVPGEDVIRIGPRPICEWCGQYVDETTEFCPARDDPIRCDPEPYD